MQIVKKMGYTFIRIVRSLHFCFERVNVRFDVLRLIRTQVFRLHLVGRAAGAVPVEKGWPAGSN